MKLVVIAVSIAILFTACRNNTSVQSNTAVRFDESSLPVEFVEPTIEEVTFIDEYAQDEYFDLNRYIVNEEGIPADSIANISETCCVEIWRPEIKDFEDEESEEADAYFTAMDDYSYYMYESSERMKGLGVSDTAVFLRFIRFDVEEEKSIVVDTEKYEFKISMLLYKKYEKPLILDITDSNLGGAKLYLGIN